MKPRRFALKYSPPTIVLEYELKSSGKLYHYRVTLGQSLKDDSQSRIAAKMYGKYRQLVAAGLITTDQIDQLVERLFEGASVRRSKPPPAPVGVDVRSVTEGQPSDHTSHGTGENAENIVKVGQDEIMEDADSFARSNDKANTSDVGTNSGAGDRVDADGNGNGDGDRDGDDEEYNDDFEDTFEGTLDETFEDGEIEDEIEEMMEEIADADDAQGIARPPTPPSVSGTDPADARTANAAAVGSPGDEDVIAKYADPSIDLNKLSKAELDKVKGEMTVEFSKRQIRPGDPDFVYDKAVDFGDPADGESNDWDESESSEAESSSEEFKFDFVNGDKLG
jgi:hypothetical protein